MAVGSSAPPRSQEEVEQVRDEPNLFLNTWAEVQATGEWSYLILTEALWGGSSSIFVNEDAKARQS